MIFFSRKAQLGEQVMMFAFMFLLVIVGGGIVIGTYLFVGGEFDFRGVEANLLSYRIASCISSGAEGREGFWLDGLNGENKNNIALLSERCKLNREVIEKSNRVKICVDESKALDCVNEARKEKIAFSTEGDFQPCGLVGGEKFLGCSSTSVGRYTVIVTSGQEIRRVQA